MSKSKLCGRVMLSIDDVNVGDRVRFNETARAMDIKNIAGEFSITEVIPCRNMTQVQLTGADGWAHLGPPDVDQPFGPEHKYVSLALLEHVSATVHSGEDD